MKKSVTVLMIILATTFVFAQEEVVVEQVETQVEQVETQVEGMEIQEVKTNLTKPFTYGVKGGISFNHFLGDIPVNLDPTLYTGFSAGVFGNYKVSDKFSIQPEILFSRKGSNFEEFDYSFEQLQILNFNLDLYISTDWIEIPILGMYHVDDKFTIFGGPYIGFYLNGTVVAEPSVAILGVELEYDIDADNLRLPDYGIVLGGAYNITEKVAVQGRWEYGIQDLADDVLVNFLDDDFIVINNSSFQLQLDFTI